MEDNPINRHFSDSAFNEMLDAICEKVLDEIAQKGTKNLNSKVFFDGSTENGETRGFIVVPSGSRSEYFQSMYEAGYHLHHDGHILPMAIFLAGESYLLATNNPELREMYEEYIEKGGEVRDHPDSKQVVTVVGMTADKRHNAVMIDVDKQGHAGNIERIYYESGSNQGGSVNKPCEFLFCGVSISVMEEQMGEDNMATKMARMMVEAQLGEVRGERPGFGFIDKDYEEGENAN